MMKIEDHPDFKEKLPRICYVLGGEDNPLRIGERFKSATGLTFWISKCGYIRWDNTSDLNVPTLCGMINNGPEKIIRRSQFSEGEKAFMRHCVSNGWEVFIRLSAGGLRMQKGEDMVVLPSELLPHLTNADSPLDASDYLEGEDAK